MKSRDFCYWLQGLFELQNPKALDEPHSCPFTYGVYSRDRPFFSTESARTIKYGSHYTNVPTR